MNLESFFVQNFVIPEALVMGPVKEPKKKNNRFINEFGSKTFCLEEDKTSNLNLKCKPCDIYVNPTQRSQMEQHVNTKKHKAALKIWKPKSQTKLNVINPQEKFYEDFTKWMIVNNIAISKLNDKCFTNFLANNMTKHIPCHMTARRKVDAIYQETMTEIKNKLKDHFILVSVDETIASDGRCVTDVIIGALKKDEFNDSYLVNCIDLDGTVNHKTICDVIYDTINVIWDGKFDREKLLLLLTDEAPYMKKAGKHLKSLFPKVIHITRLAHLINRISSFIRNEHKTADKFIAETKKTFTKSRSRIEVFKSIAPDIPLPPKPVVIRWSAWL